MLVSFILNAFQILAKILLKPLHIIAGNIKIQSLLNIIAYIRQYRYKLHYKNKESKIYWNECQ